MKKGMKFLGVLVLVLALCFTISMKEAEAAACYKVYYNWDCFSDGNFSYKTWDYYYLVLYSDGTWEDYTDGNWGYWASWGTSFMLNYQSGCYPLYSGTKKQGFMNCTDGDWAAGDPGCWYMTKINCRYVILNNAEKVDKEKSGGRDSSQP